MKKKLLKLLYYFYLLLAKLYIKKHKPFVIWITWSVWKTSCKTVVYQVLNKYIKDKKIYTSPKNFNSELGLVFSIFKLENYKPWIFSLIKIYFVFIIKLVFWKKPYDIIILEYGIDHPWDMDFLLKITKPDFSVFTKLDYVHVENFYSIEDILHEKMKLINNSKQLSFINYKDSYLRDYSENIIWDYEFFNLENSYSFEYKVINNKIYSYIKIRDKEISTNLLWGDNFLYLDLALSILKKWFSKDFEDWDFIKFETQKWRYDIYEWICDSILIDSSYNAAPESVLKMIDNTLDLKMSLFKEYSVIFVLWDMRELWDNSLAQHKKIFQYASRFWQVISVWKETKKSFWDHLWNFKYSSEAWLFLKNYIKNKSDKYIILFKWSQNTIFVEEALKQVLKNDSDINNLVRQDDFWIQKKKNY